MKQQQLPNWVSELTTSVLNVFQFEGGVRTHFAIIVKSGEDENNPDIQHIIIIHRPGSESHLRFPLRSGSVRWKQRTFSDPMIVGYALATFLSWK